MIEIPPAIKIDALLITIDSYIQQHIAIGRAKTADTYKGRLRWFLRWIKETVPDSQEVLDSDDFARFEVWLRSAKSSRLGLCLNPYMCGQTLKRLRMVMRWGHRIRYLEADYSLLVPEVGADREGGEA